MSTLYENNTIRERAELYVKREVLHRANELADHILNVSRELPHNSYYNSHLYEFSERMIKYDYDAAAMEWLNGLTDEDKIEYLADNEMTSDELTAWVLEDAEMVCCDEGLDADVIEVLEYWIVSDWFAGQLSEMGEAVADILDFNVWGRTTSGQHISLDHVVLTIAKSNIEV